MVWKIVLISLLILVALALVIGPLAIFSLWEVLAGLVLAGVLIGYYIATK